MRRGSCRGTGCSQVHGWRSPVRLAASLSRHQVQGSARLARRILGCPCAGVPVVAWAAAKRTARTALFRIFRKLYPAAPVLSAVSSAVRPSRPRRPPARPSPGKNLQNVRAGRAFGPYAMNGKGLRRTAGVCAAVRPCVEVEGRTQPGRLLASPAMSFSGPIAKDRLQVIRKITKPIPLSRQAQSTGPGYPLQASSVVTTWSALRGTRGYSGQLFAHRPASFPTPLLSCSALDRPDLLRPAIDRPDLT